MWFNISIAIINILISVVIIILFDYDFLFLKSNLNFWTIRSAYPFFLDFYYDIAKLVISIVEIIYYATLEDLVIDYSAQLIEELKNG